MLDKLFGGRKRWRREAEERGWAVVDDPRPLVGDDWNLVSQLREGKRGPFKAVVDRRLPAGEAGVIATFAFAPTRSESTSVGLGSSAGRGSMRVETSDSAAEPVTAVACRLARESPAPIALVPAGRVAGKLAGRLLGLPHTRLDDPVLGPHWMLLGDAEQAAQLQGDPALRALLVALTPQGGRSELADRATAAGLPTLLPPGLPGPKATAQVELRGDRLLVTHRGYNPLSPGPPAELIEACEAIAANYG